MKIREQWLNALLIGFLINVIKGNNIWIGPHRMEFHDNFRDVGPTNSFTDHSQGITRTGVNDNHPDNWQKGRPEEARQYDSNSWGPSDSQIKRTEGLSYQKEYSPEEGLGVQNVKSTDQSFFTSNENNRNDGWSVDNAQGKENTNQIVESTNVPRDGRVTDSRTMNEVVPEDIKKPHEYTAQEVLVAGWKPLQEGITLTAHEISDSEWNRLQGNRILTAPGLTISEWNTQYPQDVQTPGGNNEKTEGRWQPTENQSPGGNNDKTEGRWQPTENQSPGTGGFRVEGNKNGEETFINQGQNKQNEANSWDGKISQENVDRWNANDKRQDSFNGGNPRSVQGWNPEGNLQTSGGNWNVQENINNWNSGDQDSLNNERYEPAKQWKPEANFPDAGENWPSTNGFQNNRNWDNTLHTDEEHWKQGNEDKSNYNEENRQRTDETWITNSAQSNFDDNWRSNDIPLNTGKDQPNNVRTNIFQGNLNSNDESVSNERYGFNGSPHITEGNTWNTPDNSGLRDSNFQPHVDNSAPTDYAPTVGNNLGGNILPSSENSYGQQGPANNEVTPIGKSADSEWTKGDPGTAGPGFVNRIPQGNYKGSDESSYAGDNYDEASDENSIPGVAGEDYPNYLSVPETGFDCKIQDFPGYFADLEAGCQVYHVCQTDGRHDSFLCPTGTIFNQKLFTCDWWYNYDCSNSTALYSLNEMLYRESDAQGNFKGSHYPGGRVNGAQFPPQTLNIPTANAPGLSRGDGFEYREAAGNVHLNNRGNEVPVSEYEVRDGNLQGNGHLVNQIDHKVNSQSHVDERTINRGRDYNSFTDDSNQKFGTETNDVRKASSGGDYSSFTGNRNLKFGTGGNSFGTTNSGGDYTYFPEQKFEDDPKNTRTINNVRDYNSFNGEERQKVGVDQNNERTANSGRDFNSLPVEERQKFDTDPYNSEQKYIPDEGENNAGYYDNVGSTWSAELRNSETIKNSGNWKGHPDSWTPDETRVHGTGEWNGNSDYKNFNDDAGSLARNNEGSWESAVGQNWEPQSKLTGESKINEKNTIFVERDGSLITADKESASGKVNDWNEITGNVHVRADGRNDWIDNNNRAATSRQRTATENAGGEDDARLHNEGKYDGISTFRNKDGITPNEGIRRVSDHFDKNEREIPVEESFYDNRWSPRDVSNSEIRRIWEDTEGHEGHEGSTEGQGEVRDNSANRAEDGPGSKKESTYIAEKSDERILRDAARLEGIHSVFPMRLVIARSREDGSVDEKGEIAITLAGRGDGNHDSSVNAERSGARRGGSEGTVGEHESKFFEARDTVSNRAATEPESNEGNGVRMEGNAIRAGVYYRIPTEVESERSQIKGGREEENMSVAKEEGSASREDGTIISVRDDVMRDDRKYSQSAKEERAVELGTGNEMNEDPGRYEPGTKNEQDWIITTEELNPAVGREETLHGVQGDLVYKDNWQERSGDSREDIWRGVSDHEERQDSSERHYVTVSPGLEMSKHKHHLHVHELVEYIDEDESKKVPAGEMFMEIHGNRRTIHISKSKDATREDIEHPTVSNVDSKAKDEIEASSDRQMDTGTRNTTSNRNSKSERKNKRKSRKYTVEALPRNRLTQENLNKYAYLR